MLPERNPDRLPRWYFGGLSSATAACCVHPLDLIKVQLQTQQGAKTSMGAITRNIIAQDGVMGLFNGISASLLRQMTYATTRFAIYDILKARLGPNATFLERTATAAIAGSCAAIVGVPADKVNVRMQNDSKLPKEERANYKHAIDGLLRIYKQEGFTFLFSGASMATMRAVFMAIGQLSFYDQFKIILLNTPYFEENLTTHFSASLLAAGVATVITQPFDVMKTRLMSAKPGQYKGMVDVFVFTAKDGPTAFFKGFIPAFARLGPHTVLMFVFYEQLRMYFGALPTK